MRLRDGDDHTGACAMPVYNYATLDDPMASNLPMAHNLSGTYAQSINAAGQVVGYYYDSNQIAHGFLYSGGTYTTLDDPLEVHFFTLAGTFAQGINAAGQVVGVYYDSVLAPQGFLYSGGTYTTLSDPLAVRPFGTQAFGINDMGQIVGSYIDNVSQHGFLETDGLYAPIDDPLAIPVSIFAPRQIG